MVSQLVVWVENKPVFLGEFPDHLHAVISDIYIRQNWDKYPVGWKTFIRYWLQKN